MTDVYAKGPLKLPPNKGNVEDTLSLLKSAINFIQPSANYFHLLIQPFLNKYNLL